MDTVCCITTHVETSSQSMDQDTDTAQDKEPTPHGPHALQAAHEHLERGELQKASECFERAAKELESSDIIKMKISCFLNAGACLVSLGEYRKGLECLGSAASIISVQSSYESHEVDGSAYENDREILEASADVHYNSAIAYHALRDYEQAIGEFQHCIDLYEKSEYIQNVAEVLTALASCHREAGQPENERACLTRAQKIYKQLEDSSGEAMSCATLARAYLREGREEECKQMLSTAKMISSRMDNRKLLGRLYSQCGLIHSSLHQFNEALQSFERALPLVRATGSSGNSSQFLEASLLQNIGATYNERQMFSESLVYHREAAAMHGKLKNPDSEIECLCNLAFAQSQLTDYSTSASTFTEALDKAQTTENPCLQFQACEGLGVCQYHMKQYTEAVGSFNSALELLDKIKEDTGIARERVMEKLSDTTEILQKSTKASDQLSPASPECSQLPKSHSQANSISKSPLDHSVEKTSQISSKGPGKGKQRRTTETHRTSFQNQDSCDLEIQAYEETLISSDDSSDHELNASDDRNEHERTSHLEASGPGYQAHTAGAQQHTPTSISSHSSLLQGQGVNHPQSPVTEGSLAIGPNARDTYTIESSRVKSEGKRRRSRGVKVLTEIVEREKVEQAREASVHERDDPDSALPLADSRDRGLSSVQHSKVCIIL